MTVEELLGFAEGLSRIAAAGGGPKALAAHLAALLDAAVLVEDAEWHHLALAGSGSRSIPPSTRDFLHATKPNQDGLVELTPPGGPAGFAMKIKAGDAHVGWLAVFPNGKPVDGFEPALRLTASAIAVELAREIGGTKGRRRSFWERLIARAYDDVGEARDDAASRGITLASGYVAVAVEAEGLDEAAAAAKNNELRRICMDALRTGIGEVVVLERGGGFVFLCPAPLEVDAANARTAGLSLGAYIRASTTGDAGDRAQGEGPVDANLLRKVIGELARYGNNWNQVAYKLNINEAPWKLHDEIRQELANLREVLALSLEALGKKPHHA